jgi:hypothetical protein
MAGSNGRLAPLYEAASLSACRRTYLPTMPKTAPSRTLNTSYMVWSCRTWRQPVLICIANQFDTRMHTLSNDFALEKSAHAPSKVLLQMGNVVLNYHSFRLILGEDARIVTKCGLPTAAICNCLFMSSSCSKPLGSGAPQRNTARSLPPRPISRCAAVHRCHTPRRGLNR